MKTDKLAFRDSSMNRTEISLGKRFRFSMQLDLSKMNKIKK